MLDCPICFEIAGEIHQNHNEEYAKLILSKSHILWSDENISIIPSIGALNDTHVLIVPNRHVEAMCELNSIELQSVMTAKKMLDELFNNCVIYFEHGSCIKNKETSASSIVHAHLHALCLENDESLKTWFAKFFKATELDFSNISSICSDLKTNYIFYQGLDKKGLITYSDFFESQILRREISKYTKVEWNWRTYTNINLVNSVIRKYEILKDRGN